MPLHDLNQFANLTGKLSRCLLYRDPDGDKYYLLPHVTAHAHEDMPPGDVNVLKEALNILVRAYDGKRRLTGLDSVIHPLRATALLAELGQRPPLLDLLTALFHDFREDIDAKLDRVVSRLEKAGFDQSEELARRLEYLTIRPADPESGGDRETYYEYIWRLLESESAQVLRVKLCDRLDNTLDLRAEPQETWESEEFYEKLFEILFVRKYTGRERRPEHPPPSVISGSKRLYQLYKNIIFLSLVNTHDGTAGDPVNQRVFSSLARAGLREAQTTFMHIIHFHVTGAGEQRAAVEAARRYTLAGDTDRVTMAGGDQLDGLFEKYFGKDAGLRNRMLDELYRDKELMIETSLAFTVIFLNFSKIPGYRVRGIEPKGIGAVGPEG